MPSTLTLTAAAEPKPPLVLGRGEADRLIGQWKRRLAPPPKGLRLESIWTRSAEPNENQVEAPMSAIHEKQRYRRKELERRLMEKRRGAKVQFEVWWLKRRQTAARGKLRRGISHVCFLPGIVLL